LPGSGYRSLNPARRKQWVDGMLAALKERANGNGAGARGGSLAAESRAAQQARTLADASPAPRPRTAAKPPGRRMAGVQPLPQPPLIRARLSEREVQELGPRAPLYALKGVGASLVVKFEKLGVHSVGDLLALYPRRHVDYGHPVPIAELEFGREQTVRARVWSAREKVMGYRMRSTEATIGDSSGMMPCIWFNQPWVAKQLPVNAEIVVSGKVGEYQGRPKFDNPEWEIWSNELLHTGRLVPVYPLTSGLQSRTVRRLVQEALARFAPLLPDPLPRELRERLNLMPIAEAVSQMHYPSERATLEEARRRLAFEELLPIQLTVQLRRRLFKQSAPAQPLPLSAEAERAFVASLPFALTGAQQRVMFDVLSDMRRPVPMSRLVQGDVGSGKTVVAAAALVAAIENGAQGAMMAPTEILAEQHFRTLKALFGADGGDGSLAEASPAFLGRPLRIALLTGSLKTRERRQLYELIERGEVDVVCGTHALIQGGVRFRELGIAIVDEQHRFGVMQRAALRGKGEQAHAPHMLVMTATPIPRTLALTVYGDLDVSVIDEMPPGRQAVKTTWVGPDERGDAERFVRAQVEQGRQAFVICPLVEESETLDVKAATAEYERLRSKVYPDLRVLLLHGRMSGKQKDEVMRQFRDHEADILVSTAVIEVGIDVPNATVMMIEGADRFGLAQLHQFRGRVGRGSEQSYCLLLSDEPTEEARRRLELMEETSDGFRLAEADMDMRGPGQFFGTKQSGLPGLRVARLTDVKLVEATRVEAVRMLEEDPGLTRPEHHILNERVRAIMDQVVDEEH
ncbi:MAG TPA: ATP-dependent DNA helicase RecG, partial [Dehalococcoidia bacterium]|nr:ATP-dependent DNA helicase RecG [Dehalococcoidia bacterium]